MRKLLIAIILITSLSSCDAVKGILGLATSKDIEKAKMELAEKAKRDKFIADSIAAIRLDSLAKAEADSLAKIKMLDKRYYVIIGSFLEDANATDMINILKKEGYTPRLIPFKNGYKMVAAASSNSFNEARKMQDKIEYIDASPYDIWIYSVDQNLHVE